MRRILGCYCPNDSVSSPFGEAWSATTNMSQSSREPPCPNLKESFSHAFVQGIKTCTGGCQCEFITGAKDYTCVGICQARFCPPCAFADGTFCIDCKQFSCFACWDKCDFDCPQCVKGPLQTNAAGCTKDRPCGTKRAVCSQVIVTPFKPKIPDEVAIKKNKSGLI